jgi:hypothetical protein
MAAFALIHFSFWLCQCTTSFGWPLESTVAVKGNQRRRSHEARRGQAPEMGSRPVGCRVLGVGVSSSRGGIPHEIVRSEQNFRLFLVMMFLQFTGSRHKMLLSYVDLYLL